MIIPTIREKTADGIMAYDPFSRLLDDNIIYLSGEVNSDSADLIVAQLLFLSAKDETKDINLYINSPGGSVTAGFAIYDTMNLIPNKVSTIGVGLCASMGAFLLASGEEGMRYALPNAEIMIHQPLGGANGQATDIMIVAENIKNTKNKINKILAEKTGKTVKAIEKATDRDNWLSASKAKDFGLIDEIL